MEINPEYSKAECKAAELPHQLFVFNMVGNHVLLTLVTVSVANVNPTYTLIVPILSLLITAYLMVRGRSGREAPSLLVRSHWHIALQRIKLLLIGYGFLVVATLFALFLYSVAGGIKEMVYAVVGGLGILPVMSLVIYLTVVESDSLYQAAHGNIPDRVRERMLAVEAE